MRYVDGSGYMREAHENVEVDGAIGVPRLRRGDDLPEHLPPPDHRPVERRAHARRLQDLPKVWGLVRVRNDSGALVLHHPPRRPEGEGNTQAVLLRRKPMLGYQEIVLAVRRGQEEPRDNELPLPSLEPAWTEVRLLIPQDLARRCREVRERALDVRRAVGGPRHLGECRQRLGLQRVDIALRHRVLPGGSWATQDRTLACRVAFKVLTGRGTGVLQHWRSPMGPGWPTIMIVSSHGTCLRRQCADAKCQPNA